MTVLAALVLLASDEHRFETSVRPLLMNKCAACHGASSAASGLRVDSREALLRGGSRGPAIFASKPQESLLLQAVKHTHASLKMPPGKALAATEVEALEAWIREGAHWPATAPKPAAPTQFWSFAPLRPVTGKIDQHVRQALQKEGIAPNPRADKRTLLRRLHADLTGLPPTSEEAEAFLRDAAPHATANLVDRLIASPAFGERWGRHWLDVARFGEDDFSGTAPRPYPNAWRFRDWVVEAFNQDLPYDAFVKEQIAGDLLGKPAATGLFGAGPWYFGISQPPQARADERHDRVDMVTRGFLGLTAACARCHDHKYDPIPQKDYYALAGVFASSEYKDYPLVDQSTVDAFNTAQKKIKAAEKEVEQFLDAQREQLALIYARQTTAFLASASGQDNDIQKRWQTYLAKKEEDHSFLKAWQASKSPEDAAKFQETLLDVIERKKSLDEENKRALIRGTPPADPLRRKTILPFNYDSEADFNPGSDVVTKSLDRESHQLYQKLIGNKDAVYRLDDKAVEERLSGEWKKHLETLRADVDRLKKASPPAYPYLHGMAEHSHPIDLPLDIRGNPNETGDTVPRHFLTCLSANGEVPLRTGSGRMQLADAIVAHPLAARVMANRIWAWLLGQGVVRTPSNFGVVGERPANPELLEYLAARYKALGFSTKALIREIVLSETYQSSATGTREKDPGNSLFWRANRRRLDAESIRDALLAASGELDLKTGGESAELSDKNLRRTIYVRVGRYQQNETLALFDFPSSSVHVEKRASTNVPLQKLFFLNSAFFRLRAGAFAKRAEAKPEAQRIDFAYTLLFQRPPTKDERVHGSAFLEKGSWTQYAQVLLSTNEFLYVD